jgi:hypothetical protein
MERSTDHAAVPREGGDGNRRRRDRHRRGDRGERPEGGEPHVAEARVENAGMTVVPEAHVPTAEAAHVAQPDIAPPMPAAEPPRAIVPVEVERTIAPVEVERAIAPVPAPAAAKPESIPQPRPSAPPPRPVEALPPVSMTLPADSGLELVETRFKAIPVPEPEPAPPAGARRVRPPRVVIPDEPLQIVETHKEGQPPAG